MREHRTNILNRINQMRARYPLGWKYGVLFTFDRHFDLFRIESSISGIVLDIIEFKPSLEISARNLTGFYIKFEFEEGDFRNIDQALEDLFVRLEAQQRFKRLFKDIGQVPTKAANLQLV